MLLYLAGLASGVVLVILVVASFGVYARRHEEAMMRFFVRRTMRGASFKSSFPPPEKNQTR